MSWTFDSTILLPCPGRFNASQLFFWCPFLRESGKMLGLRLEYTYYQFRRYNLVPSYLSRHSHFYPGYEKMRMFLFILIWSHHKHLLYLSFKFFYLNLCFHTIMTFLFYHIFYFHIIIFISKPNGFISTLCYDIIPFVPKP